jgi:Spy/CpxP family protein refolding chaperone
MQENLNLSSIDNYIATVSAYEMDATERRDPLTAYALGATQRNLIRLKVEIQEAQEITPEAAEKFSQLIDRAEALNYLGQ